MQEAEIEPVISGSDGQILYGMPAGLLHVERSQPRPQDPADYILVGMNQRFAAALGWGPKAIGAPLSSLEPNLQYYWGEIFEQVLNAQAPITFEYQMTNAAGKWVEVVVFSAGPQRLACLAHDITAKKWAQRTYEIASQFGMALGHALSQKEMSRVILDQLIELVSFDEACLSTFSPLWEVDTFARERTEWQMPNNDTLPLLHELNSRLRGTMQPYINKEVLANPEFQKNPRLRGVQTLIGIPLMNKEAIIGALWVSSHEVMVDQEIELFRTLGQLIGQGLLQAAFYDQSQRRMRQLSALHRIDMAITADDDPEGMLRVVLREVISQLKGDAANVLLLDGSTGVLRSACNSGYRTNAIPLLPVRLGEGPTGVAAAEQRRIDIPDLSKGAIVSGRATLMVNEGFQSYYAVPLVAKGQVKGVLEILYRRKFRADADWLEFLDTLATQTAIALETIVLFTDLLRSNNELARAYDDTIVGWSRAVEMRDQETEDHTQRAAQMTVQLAQALGVPDQEIRNIRWGALLHDIGKLAIPDAILRKPGPLDDEEWKEMRRHPEYAYEMLLPVSYLHSVLDIPYHHHEKWDGTGYPLGLKGEEIPLPARIFAVVDVWDALSQDRPYRKGWPEEKVREHIRGRAGTHFDPLVVEAFLKMLDDLL